MAARHQPAISACRRSPAGGPAASTRNERHALRLRYLIDTSQQAELRPRQPFDGRRLPGVASPDVAKRWCKRRLELPFGGRSCMRASWRWPCFPTTQDSDSFVIADEASLASALGADDLPTSIPDEPGSGPGQPRRGSPPPCATRGCRARRVVARGHSQRAPQRSDRTRHRLVTRRRGWPPSRLRCSASRSRRSDSAHESDSLLGLSVAGRLASAARQRA
jgi:hypothetical protein